jgi:hypothetical protein
MKTFDLHEKVMEEIRQIPENRLPEIYSLIHYFRLGLEADGKDAKNTMRFAGCWQEMTDSEFGEFSEEIRERRRQAFSGRKNRETFPD